MESQDVHFGNSETDCAVVVMNTDTVSMVSCALFFPNSFLRKQRKDCQKQSMKVVAVHQDEDCDPSNYFVTEHVCSIVASLFRNLNNANKLRLLQKFQEDDCAKVSNLIIKRCIL